MTRWGVRLSRFDFYNSIDATAPTLRARAIRLNDSVHSYLIRNGSLILCMAIRSVGIQFSGRGLDG